MSLTACGGASAALRRSAPRAVRAVPRTTAAIIGRDRKVARVDIEQDLPWSVVRTEPSPVIGQQGRRISLVLETIVAEFAEKDIGNARRASTGIIGRRGDCRSDFVNLDWHACCQLQPPSPKSKENNLAGHRTAGISDR